MQFSEVAHGTLLPILRFVLDEKFQQTASKFAILYIGIQKPQVALSVFHFMQLYVSKRFAGTFCRAQTLKLGGVLLYCTYHRALKMDLYYCTLGIFFGLFLQV